MRSVRTKDHIQWWHRSIAAVEIARSATSGGTAKDMMDVKHFGGSESFDHDYEMSVGITQSAAYAHLIPLRQW